MRPPSRRRLHRPTVDRDGPVSDRHAHGVAVLDAASQDLLSKRVLHIALDHALQRSGTIGRIITPAGEPSPRLVNYQFLDLISIQVPRERNLKGKDLQDFNKERARIEELMRRAPVMMANK